VRFFRKKSTEEAAPAEAAAPEALEETSPSQADGQADKPKPRRRRGSRGGRGRGGKKNVEATAESGAKTDSKAEPKAEPKQRQSRQGKPKDGEETKPRRRRTQTAKRSALPKVKKEILVSVEVTEQRVAVLEDDVAVEVYLGRPSHRSVAGNVYKGVVDNVLPGMEASFVEIGLEKNGFLYVDEIVVPELEGKRHGRRIQELIERGQEVLVQAVKDPMGTKGARLTTEISLPGRFLVFVPYGDGIGVSRRLEDEERERLKGICKDLDLPDGGLIVRTAAEGASKEELEGDLALLQKLWSTIQGRAKRAEAPSLVYQESELPLRIIRDLFIRDFEKVVVDHDRTYRRIVGYLKRTSPELAARVELYKGKEPLMESYGVDEAVRSTLNRRVDLPSGGYLIFDYAEAFTVIDVNTGRFVGARGRSSGARLEDTITKNNLEAVSEVVRQLRLRDVGGIIVIDFIDMANPRNRHLVEEALERELERDRTKTYVVEISPLGLVEMTRQNVTDGPREILTNVCATCKGDGVVVSMETHAVDAERRIRRLVAQSKSKAFHIELNSQVAATLIGPGAERLAELEKETGRTLAVKGRQRAPHDHFVVLEEGSPDKVEDKAFPVERGQELEVELEEAHQHSDTDAIARVDGYVVTVKDAASRVGENVSIRIEDVSKTTARAVIAEESANGDDPTKEKPKKKTRRGTRGGRNRKRKPAGASVNGDAPEREAEAEPEPGEAEAEAEDAPRYARRSRPQEEDRDDRGGSGACRGAGGARGARRRGRR
jgi:ribonuclease G